MSSFAVAGIYIPDKNRNAFSRFFYFSELDQIFQLLHLYSSVAHSSVSIMPEN